jgi:hypothetical protein
MTTFLLDIWHDLREKRLWPVALGLVLATVAIPVVMIKPAAPAPVNTAPPSATTAALPTVSLDQGVVDSSHLDAFDIKDPFSSRADEGSGAIPNGLKGAGGVDVPAGTPSGDGGMAPGASGGSMAGGSGGGAPSGGSGGSGSGGGTRYFTYTVDVHFGKRGATKAFKSVSTLDLLPDDQNPIVSFMGMTDNAKTAVFFIVDPSFKADGEGQCAPSEEDCRFVYLGVADDRDEETLSAAEGNLEYTLQLDRINIKRLSENEAVGDSKPDTTDTTTPSSKRQTRKTLLTVPLVSRR